MRVAFTDGEMTNLSPKFGQLLCACIVEFSPRHPQGTNLQTFVLDTYKTHRWNDKGLALRWRNALESYDIIVTWNGRRFDIPFLDGRLAEYRLRPTRVNHHEDLMYSARHHMRCLGLKDSKLETVARKLKLPVQKTPLIPQQWVKAAAGHYPSYQSIITHCRHDVRVLSAAWWRLKHLIGEIKAS